MAILETDRLILRTQEESDLDAIDQMQSSPEVMKYVGEGKIISREITEKSIKFWIKYGEEKRYSSWAIVEKSTGKLIGKCGLCELKDKSDIELFYMLAKDSWGRGYATEISKAVLKYGQEELGLNRIVALVYPENKVSQKVIEKMGMHYEKEKEVNGIKLLMYSAEKKINSME